METIHFLIGLRGTKAEIEALTGLLQGSRLGYAIDTDELGTYDGAAWHWGALDGSTTDHGALSGLADDDHSQYILGDRDDWADLVGAGNADLLHVHSAGVVTIADAGEYYTGSTVEAALQALGATGVLTGTLALGGFTLTVPATGTTALLATANLFTAQQSIKLASATSTARFGVISDATTYNLISLNGTMTNVGHLGMAGGGGTDKNLYLNVPTGGTYNFRVNATNVVTISTAGALTAASVTGTSYLFTNGTVYGSVASLTGGIPILFNGEFQFKNSTDENANIYDIQSTDTKAMAFRVRPGSAASYSVFGDNMASFFEFHQVSTAVARLLLTASTTLANGYSWVSLDGGGNPGPIGFDFATGFTSKTRVFQIGSTGLISIFSPTTTNNAIKEAQRLQAQVSTGSAGGANGFGVGQSFYAETATDLTYQQQGLIATYWVDATNATRKATLALSAYDTAERKGIEIRANGSTPDIVLLGDTWWEGEGFGLPYGSFYGNDIAWAQASAVQDTWYEIADADIADGQLNLVTHDGNGKLTAAKAGRYHIEYHLVATCSVAGKQIQSAISISGTEQNDGIDHETSSAVNGQKHMGSTAILDLAANATIEISLRTTDAGTPDIGVEHINVSIFMLGGT